MISIMMLDLRRGDVGNLARMVFSCLFVGWLSLALLAPEAAADWEFGEQRLVRNYERVNNNLLTQPTGRAGLYKFTVVARIGGIAFESIAQWNISLTDSAIELNYSPTKPDGERLQIKVGNKTITPRLYDWELKPIANFADSPYTGVVSLFGDGPDRDHYYYIDLHPAFEDTLLGIRLLQVDIILMDPAGFWSLPKQDGETILGPGETAPDPTAAKDAANHVEDWLKNSRIQSWVFTDVDEPGTVTVKDTSINIDVKPYFFFWKAKLDESIKQQASELVLLESIIREAKRSDFIRRLEGRESKAPYQVTELERRRDVLKQQIGNYEPAVESIGQATTALRTNRELLRKLNPAVFNAADKTAQFAALFRVVKKNGQSEWRDFIEKVRAVHIPAYETPNQMSRDRRDGSQ